MLLATPVVYLPCSVPGRIRRKKNIRALSLKLSACSLQLHLDKLTLQISSLALVLSFARIIVFPSIFLHVFILFAQLEVFGICA